MGRTYHLHLQGQNHHEADNKNSEWYLLHEGFLLGIFFDPENEGNMFLQNIG
jgi:hypothetical protein